MTCRDRIIATIEGSPVDHAPHHSDITFVSKLKLSEYYKVELDEVEKRIRNHLHYVNFLPPREFREQTADRRRHDSGTFSAEGLIDGEGRILDEFGVLWDNEIARQAGDWGMIRHPVKNLDFSLYRWPKGNSEGRFDGFDEVVKTQPDLFQTLIMTGLFDTAWHVTGYEDALMAMADPNPQVINYMLDNSLRFLVEVIEMIPQGLFDSIRFIEDWGVQRGLVMGETHWRRLLKPRLKELYSTVKEKGLFVHSHSCGDNSGIFSDLVEIGVDISDPLQPEVMDIEKIKDDYGKELTLMGGLPCQSVLPLGTPDEVFSITEKTFEIMNKGGRYILGGAGSFSTETPAENINAIVEYYSSKVAV